MTECGRRCAALAAAALLAAPGAAAAQSSVQDPPSVPSSTKDAKRCNTTRNEFGSSFRVYVVTGKRRISCRGARAVVKRGMDARGYTYFDWTKGGNGPWSDVWEREDERAW